MVESEKKNTARFERNYKRRKKEKNEWIENLGERQKEWKIKNKNDDI